jgi:hypothetical protein
MVEDPGNCSDLPDALENTGGGDEHPPVRQRADAATPATD